MRDYLSEDDSALLEKHGLAHFDALWEAQLHAVDEPNTEHGGWSEVFRLELEGRGFFIKRQSNYFTRSLAHPLGEPTVAREFRTIMRYQELAIPSLHAVFFGERRVGGERRAILVTRALDGWTALENFMADWQGRDAEQQRDIISVCARLVGRLHASGLRHGCLYPKHLFLREQEGRWEACLIDLEKTRRLWFGWRDQIRDLETFLRKVSIWDREGQHGFLSQYLQTSRSPGSMQTWLERLGRRRAYKEQRH
ncbi:MAG: lipopolysaccharide kinase InaA family protein [Desulfuromonadales bacterium]|nr:lipopolysaccharide kinase InaA family protein [Desulfuromonadales bacterium]